MATEMNEIFRDFLMSVDDYSLTIGGERDAISLSNEVLGHYRYARRKFTKCKKDLSLNYQSFDEMPEDEKMLIQSELTYEEIDIIVSLMMVSYLRPIINSNKVLRQALTDKDFNLTSQANHLNQLTIWYRRLQTEAERAMTKYTYRELGD